MGSRGGNAPNPFTMRKVTTRFLRIPVGDWPAIKIGRKTEFRRPTGGRIPIFPYTPTPVVAYTMRGQTYDHQLMVLEGLREDMLWSISESPESLVAEGFDTYEEFRTYWRGRHRTFLPDSMVYVFNVRPLCEEPAARALELMTLGAGIIERLYGEFLR